MRCCISRCTHVGRLIVGLTEVIRDRVLNAILEIGCALGQDTLRRTLDVSRKDTFTVRLIELLEDSSA